MKRMLCFVVLLALLCICLAGCAGTGGSAARPTMTTYFLAGTTPAVGSTPAAPQQTPSATQPSDATQQTPSATASPVYWVDGGSKYHSTPDCSALSRSDPDGIREGGAAQAKQAGKDAPCKKCF